jgi:hypothetical protein
MACLGPPGESFAASVFAHTVVRRLFRQYAEHFKRNLVDGLVLMSLTERDLESELGVQLPVKNTLLRRLCAQACRACTRPPTGLYAGAHVAHGIRCDVMCARSCTGASCFFPVTESPKAAECRSQTPRALVWNTRACALALACPAAARLSAHSQPGSCTIHISVEPHSGCPTPSPRALQ